MKPVVKSAQLNMFFMDLLLIIILNKMLYCHHFLFCF